MALDYWNLRQGESDINAAVAALDRKEKEEEERKRREEQRRAIEDMLRYSGAANDQQPPGLPLVSLTGAPNLPPRPVPPIGERPPITAPPEPEPEPTVQPPFVEPQPTWRPPLVREEEEPLLPEPERQRPPSAELLPPSGGQPVEIEARPPWRPDEYEQPVDLLPLDEDLTRTEPEREDLFAPPPSDTVSITEPVTAAPVDPARPSQPWKTPDAEVDVTGLFEGEITPLIDLPQLWEDAGLPTFDMPSFDPSQLQLPQIDLPPLTTGMPAPTSRFGTELITPEAIEDVAEGIVIAHDVSEEWLNTNVPALAAVAERVNEIAGAGEWVEGEGFFNPNNPLVRTPYLIFNPDERTDDVYSEVARQYDAKNLEYYRMPEEWYEALRSDTSRPRWVNWMIEKWTEMPLSSRGWTIANFLEANAQGAQAYPLPMLDPDYEPREGQFPVVANPDWTLGALVGTSLYAYNKMAEALEELDAAVQEGKSASTKPWFPGTWYDTPEDLKTELWPGGPKVDSSFLLGPNGIQNWQTYWNEALTQYETQYEVDEEHKAWTTPMEAEQARVTAESYLFGGHSGETFDRIIENYANANRLTHEAEEMSKLLRPGMDSAERQEVMAEIGLLSAQAALLRAKDPYEIAQENMNWGTYMVFTTLFDPLNIVDAVFTAGKAAPTAARLYDAAFIGSKQFRPGALPSIKTAAAYVKDWMMTARGKANTRSFRTYQGLLPVISEIDNIGDAITILTALSRDAAKFMDEGIPIDDLTGAFLKAGGVEGEDGVFRKMFNNIAWFDPEVRVALTKGGLDYLDEQIPYFQSLMGKPEDLFDKALFAAELGQALIFNAAEAVGINKFQGMPFGTVSIAMEQMPGGKAVLRYLSNDMHLLGITAPMPQKSAQKLYDDATRWIAEGRNVTDAYNLNVVQKWNDTIRHAMSTVLLNVGLGGLKTNALGHNVTSMWDNTWSTARLEDQLEYLDEFFGGVAGSLRYVEGSPFTNLFYTGKKGKGKNPITWWINKVKGWRTGQTTLLGTDGRIKIGEEAASLSIFATAHRNFIKDQLMNMSKPVDNVLKSLGFTDTADREFLRKQLLGSFQSGGMRALQENFQSLLEGRTPFSLDGLLGIGAEALDTAARQQIEGMLRNLTPQNIDTLLPQIEFELEKALHRIGASNPDVLAASRRYWTMAEDAGNTRDFIQTLQNHAKNLPTYTHDEIMKLAATYDNGQKAVRQAMVDLIELAAQKNNTSPILQQVYAAKALIQAETRADMSNMAAGIAATMDALGIAPGSPQAQDYWTSFLQVWSTEAWVRANAKITDLITDATTSIQNGTAPTYLSMYAGTTADLNQTVLEHIDAIDDLPTYIQDFLQLDPKSGGWDGPLFQESRDMGYALRDYAEAIMWTGWQASGDITAADEMVSAMSDVSAYFAQSMAKVAAKRDEVLARLSAGEPGKIWHEFFTVRNKEAQARTEWTFQRYIAAAGEMVRPKVSQKYNYDLTFTLPGKWKYTNIYLQGQDWANPKRWRVQFADGTFGTLPTKDIPKEILAGYKNLQIEIQKEISSWLGTSIEWGGMMPGGLPDDLIRKAESLIEKATDPNTSDVWNHVKIAMAEAMASPQYTRLTPRDGMEYVRDATEIVLAQMRKLAPAIADTNNKTWRIVGDPSKALSRWNKLIVPEFEKMTYRAAKYADDMQSFGLLNYMSEYPADLLVGMVAPYHFFFTRMGKNAAERFLFHPGVAAAMNKGLSYMRQYNMNVKDFPERDWNAIPGMNTRALTQKLPQAFGMEGLTDEQYAQIFGDKNWHLRERISNAVPLFNFMWLNGWTDMGRRDFMQEYVQNAFMDEAFPNANPKTNSFIAGIILADTLAQEAGLGTNWAVQGLTGTLYAQSTGKPNPLWAGSFGSPLAAISLATARTLQAMGVVEPGYIPGLMPPWYEHLVTREGARRANLQQEGYNVPNIDAAIAHYSQRSRLGAEGERPDLDAAVAEVFPTAEDLYNQTAQDVLTEYLTRALLSVAGVGVAVESPADRALYNAQKLRTAATFLNYEGEMINPLGSAEARKSLYYPNLFFSGAANPNYVPGLIGRNQTYGVMSEEPEFTGGPMAPGAVAVRTELSREGQDDYRAELTARKDAQEKIINEKYGGNLPLDNQAAVDEVEAAGDAAAQPFIEAREERQGIRSLLPGYVEDQEDLYRRPLEQVPYYARETVHAEYAVDDAKQRSSARQEEFLAEHNAESWEDLTPAQRNQYFAIPDEERQRLEEEFQPYSGVVTTEPLGLVPPLWQPPGEQRAGAAGAGRPVPPIGPAGQEPAEPQAPLTGGELWDIRTQQSKEKYNTQALLIVKEENAALRWERHQDFLASVQYGATEFADYGVTADQIMAYWDQSKGEGRSNYRRENPTVGAALMAMWHQEEWEVAKGVGFTHDDLIAWAGRPAWDPDNPDVRTAYYEDNPGAWLMNAYISGRPGDFTDDKAIDEYKDWGVEYNEAIERFGPDIWDLVMQYRALPKGTGARSEFRQQYPQYNAWNDWWYANMPDRGDAYQPYQRRAGGFYRRGGGGGYSRASGDGDQGPVFYRSPWGNPQVRWAQPLGRGGRQWVYEDLGRELQQRAERRRRWR